jgi:hypothetical protein
MTRAAVVRFAVLALVVASACVSRSKHLTHLGELRPGERAIVGKFRVDPPFGFHEREPRDKYERTLQRVWLYMDRELHSVDSSLGIYRGGYSETQVIRFGDPFYLRTRSDSQVLLYLKRWLDTSRTRDEVWPLGMAVPLEPNDVAVYIGTIVFPRDPFWTVGTPVVIDEYEEAASDFEKRYGRADVLAKRLAIPIAWDEAIPPLELPAGDVLDLSGLPRP